VEKDEEGEEREADWRTKNYRKAEGETIKEGI